MRTISGLTTVKSLIAAFFASYATAAIIGTLTLTGAGTAAITASGTPASDYDVRVKFVAGGTVGTPGIQYVASLDGGDTYQATPADLGSATSLAVYSAATGVTLALGAGTVLANEIVAFTTETARKTAYVGLGWREKVSQLNQGVGGANRVIIQPGDDTGRDGEIVPVARPGRRIITAAPPDNTTANEGLEARTLWDWERTALVSVWACDPARPRDDTASIEAVERLLEDVLQALQHTEIALASWGPPTWTVKTTDTEYGREVRIPLRLRTTFFDIPTATVTPVGVLVRDPAA